MFNYKNLIDKKTLTMGNPIIILGMHRSGSSLLTRILEELGVFVGAKLSGNHEAKFFQELNIWLFAKLGGRWDYPPKMSYLLSNEEFLQIIVAHWNQTLNSTKLIKYLGWRNYIRKETFFDEMTELWGWKDPRNVFTLPVWLEIFPNAKILYIERHGIDVANSLRERSVKNLRRAKIQMASNKKTFTNKTQDFGLSSESLRCCELEGAFSLWEEYVKESKTNLKIVDSNRLLTLRYENLLLDTPMTINKLNEFLGLDSHMNLSSLSINLQKDRAFAYRENPKLREFARKVSNRLTHYEV